MGLGKSIRRRLALTEGKSFWDGARTFFLPRRVRRKIQQGKLSAVPKGMSLSPKVVEHLMSHFDWKWYAERNQLSNENAAISHYLQTGLERCLAPSAAFARQQSSEMNDWAIEYFSRLGFPLGLKPLGEMNSSPRDGFRDAFSIRNQASKKLAVVSANFSGHDPLLPIDERWSEGVDFYLFTDQEFEDTGDWKPVRLNYFDKDPRRRARFAKTHLCCFFHEYEWVMWIDANVLICRHPSEILNSYDLDGYEFSTFRHWGRGGIVAEAAACVSIGKESPAVIASHLSQVAGHRAFRENALFATMVFFMKPGSSAAAKMCSEWWRQIVRGSRRDQLSLPIAIAETAELKWTCFPESRIEMSANFFRMNHL